MFVMPTPALSMSRCSPLRSKFATFLHARSFSHSCRQKSPFPLPTLCIERQDRIEENVPEEDLYRYTRHRWLFNEKNELASRYLKFDLIKLIETAVKACHGAQHCTKVTKCLEGLHNKAFLLTMDNGTEVFAKLPNPNAGPAHLMTASEVATCEFAREFCGIPVPRVLSWSSDAASNPVGAEYIIQEKARGARLGSVWGLWPRESKLKLIRQVVEVENKLSSVELPMHGALYFTEDLTLLPGYPDVDSAGPGSLSRFSIGPLTSAGLWSGLGRKMKLERGPWHDIQRYAQALGRNEISWIKAHAKPRMNYHRSSHELESPEAALALLTQYMQVSPYLAPAPDNQHQHAHSKILWHPDLHLDNVFVDPSTHEITSIVDWQSASVAPLFYHSGIPRIFRHLGPVRQGWVVPSRPDNFERLDEAEQAKIDSDLESETMHKYYEAQVYKNSPRHWAVLSNKSGPVLRKPTWLVTSAWENKDLFFLRDALIAVAAHWEDIFPDDQIPCPLKFTEQELEMHAREEENMDGVGQILALFRDQGVLPVDGMVQPEDYEAARENSHRFKDVFVGLGKDEAEKKLFAKLWPYQDEA